MPRRSTDSTRYGGCSSAGFEASLEMPVSKAKLLVAAAALGLFLWTLPSNAASLTPDGAASHVGQNATVCGVVTSAKFDAHLRSRTTFLDFGKRYPDQAFTAVIWDSDRAKFV